MKIEYLEKDHTGLDVIEPLWEKLKEHHRVRSVHFKEQFSKTTWEMRRKEILDKAHNGAMLVHLAKDNDKVVGYCVTSIDDKNIGEIETIFVEAEYRRVGIGVNFMRRAIAWMDAHAVTEKSLPLPPATKKLLVFTPSSIFIRGSAF